MNLGQGPGFARRVFLEGQDPIPDGLRMGGGGGGESDGQREASHDRTPSAVPAEEPGDQPFSS